MDKLNRGYLEAGVRFLLEEKPRWSSDFHNDFYRHLARLRANGLTDDWWKEIVDILAKWVALRPKTKLFVYERGQARLHDLGREYKQLLSKCKGRTPSNLLLEWKDIEALFVTAKDIKDVSSPVFASKLCHFIAPGVFPVIDGEVLGGSKDYRAYWQICRDLWLTTKDTDSLIRVFADKVGTDIVSDYPWTTKIFESCLIGERANK